MTTNGKDGFPFIYSDINVLHSGCNRILGPAIWITKELGFIGNDGVFGGWLNAEADVNLMWTFYEGLKSLMAFAMKFKEIYTNLVNHIQTYLDGKLVMCIVKSGEKKERKSKSAVVVYVMSYVY